MKKMSNDRVMKNIELSLRSSKMGKISLISTNFLNFYLSWVFGMNEKVALKVAPLDS